LIFIPVRNKRAARRTKDPDRIGGRQTETDILPISMHRTMVHRRRHRRRRRRRCGGGKNCS